MPKRERTAEGRRALMYEELKRIDLGRYYEAIAAAGALIVSLRHGPGPEAFNMETAARIEAAFVSHTLTVVKAERREVVAAVLT